MLFSTKMRLSKLVTGIILLFGGIFSLLLPCMFAYKDYINHTLGLISIFSCISMLLWSFVLLYCSVKCFIAYGMSKGVDYCLEKQSSNNS